MSRKPSKSDLDDMYNQEVIDLLVNYETMDDDEFEERFNALPTEFQDKFSDEFDDILDDTIGDPSWRDGRED